MKIDENAALFLGIGMLAVAGLVTLSTYISGGPDENYLVTMGLVVIGGFNLLCGIYSQIRHGSRT